MNTIDLGHYRSESAVFATVPSESLPAFRAWSGREGRDEREHGAAEDLQPPLPRGRAGGEVPAADRGRGHGAAAPGAPPCDPEDPTGFRHGRQMHFCVTGQSSVGAFVWLFGNFIRLRQLPKFHIACR